MVLPILRIGKYRQKPNEMLKTNGKNENRYNINS